MNDVTQTTFIGLYTNEVILYIKYFLIFRQISVVTRDEVGAYKPYLWEQSVFVKGPMFRDWLLTKVSIANLEREYLKIKPCACELV